MNGINPPGIPAAVTARPENGQKTMEPRETGLNSFGDMLNLKIAGEQSGMINFSKHALTRTEQRGITLTQEDMARLDDAVVKAKDKGLTDTLVFMDNTAYIVNVPNRVVVTVMDNRETDNTVFTNIDGAVIV